MTTLGLVPKPVTVDQVVTEEFLPDPSSRPYHRDMPTVELPVGRRSRCGPGSLSPLAGGGTLHVADGLVEVDDAGRIAVVGPVAAHRPTPLARPSTSGRGSSCPASSTSTPTCRRCPNAGLGYALDLLTGSTG